MGNAVDDGIGVFFFQSFSIIKSNQLAHRFGYNQ